MRWIATAVLSVALAVTLGTPSAFAKGKPAPNSPKTHGRITSAPAASVGGGICTNANEMQSTDDYVLVCFTGCTIPADPELTDQPEQLWAVLRSDFDSGVYWVSVDFGCAGWYYFA